MFRHLECGQVVNAKIGKEYAYCRKCKMFVYNKVTREEYLASSTILLKNRPIVRRKGRRSEPSI